MNKERKFWIPSLVFFIIASIIFIFQVLITAETITIFNLPDKDLGNGLSLAILLIFFVINAIAKIIMSIISIIFSIIQINCKSRKKLSITLISFNTIYILYSVIYFIIVSVNN